MKSFEKMPLQADPTKSSPVFREKADEFIHQDIVKKADGSEQFEREVPAFIDNEGETFYQLNKEEPEQFIMTKILKGIVNVSDVIFKDGNYYSREIDLDRVEKETSQEEQLADHVITMCLFSEGDHGVINGEEHNLKKKDGKRALYDFHMATLPNSENDFYYSLKSSLEGGTQDRTDLEYDRNNFKNILQSKLFLLENQISQDFVMAILNELPPEDIFISSTPTLEGQAKELTEALLFKINSLKKELMETK